MPASPTAAEMRRLLGPFVPETLSDDLLSRLAAYLDVLLRWNARTNLTAVRDSAEIVSRHFGESLAAAAFAAEVAGPSGQWLDVGSGAGFPGLPAAMYLPDWRVTLAESQGKKAAFLAEVARQVAAPVEVWAARVESMPGNRIFDVVSLRAVDRPNQARAAARTRVRAGGWLLEMLSAQQSSPCGDLDEDAGIGYTEAGDVRERKLPTGSLIRMTRFG